MQNFGIVEQPKFLMGVIGETHDRACRPQIESVGKALQGTHCVLRFSCVGRFDNQYCIGINSRQNLGNCFDLLCLGHIMAAGPTVIDNQRVIAIKQVGEPFNIVGRQPQRSKPSRR